MIINEHGYWEDEDLGLIHRNVYKTNFGKIPPGWIVHHVDGDKLNNRAENLVAMSSHCHSELHAWQRRIKRTLSLEENKSWVAHYEKQTQNLIYELDGLKGRVKSLKKEIRKRNKLHLKKPLAKVEVLK